jgi:hypothetical protein
MRVRDTARVDNPSPRPATESLLAPGEVMLAWIRWPAGMTAYRAAEAEKTKLGPKGHVKSTVKASKPKKK